MSNVVTWPREQKKLSSEPDRSDIIRDDILEKVMSHIEVNGFRGTSMRDIAEICNVTKPTIYYYYKSKNEILEHLYRRYTSMFYEAIDAVLRSDQPAAIKLRTLVREQVVFSHANRQFQKIFLRERHELEKKVVAELARQERQYEAAVQAVIEDGQRSGEFRDIDAKLAMLTILGLLSSVHRWIPHAGMGTEEAASGIVELLMNGIFVSGN